MLVLNIVIAIAFNLLCRWCSLESEPHGLYHRLARGFVPQDVLRCAGSLTSSSPDLFSFKYKFFPIIIYKFQFTVLVLECTASNLSLRSCLQVTVRIQA